jgi:hypothetical protein
MKSALVLAVVLAAGSVLAQDLPGPDGTPLSPDGVLAGKALAACYTRAASLLDDLKSDARTIADATEASCERYWGPYQTATRSQCPATLALGQCLALDEKVWAEGRLQIVLEVRAWRAAHPGKTPPWASAAAAAACPHPDAC